MTNPIDNPKDISAIQTALSSLGYNIGHEGVNGKNSHEFHKALETFQKDYQLRTTGKVNDETLDVLNRALNGDYVAMEIDPQPHVSLIHVLGAKLKSALHPHPTLPDPDPYRAVEKTTYSLRGNYLDWFGVISGEKYNNTTGIVHWMSKTGIDGKTEDLLNLSYGDPRFQVCNELAKQLKKDYPLDKLNPSDPKDFVEIVTREKIITSTLAEKFHEVYGGYNFKGAENPEDPSMHHDTDRAAKAAKGEGVVPSIGEFNRDELICRHVAPLTASFLTTAGMKVLCMAGSMAQTFLPNGSGVEPKEDAAVGDHVFVVSRMTGNVIDMTSPDPDFAYRVRRNPTSLERIIEGTAIVTSDYDSGDVGVSVYNGKSFTLGDTPNSVIKSEADYKQAVLSDDFHIAYITMSAESTENMPLLHEEVKTQVRKHAQKLRHMKDAPESKSPSWTPVEMVDLNPNGVSPALHTPYIPLDIDAPIKGK